MFTIVSHLLSSGTIDGGSAERPLYLQQPHTSSFTQASTTAWTKEQD